jgi:hypothetical protein
MIIFRRKKTCEISTENYVLCSFELKNDPIFRICAIREFSPISIKITRILMYLSIYTFRISVILKSRFSEARSRRCYYLWALGYPEILKGQWHLACSWRFWYSNRAICKILFLIELSAFF